MIHLAREAIHGRTIVCCIDDSQHAALAARVVGSLAQALDARIVLVTVFLLLFAPGAAILNRHG
jgi:hypothetical protein